LGVLLFLAVARASRRAVLALLCGAREEETEVRSGEEEEDVWLLPKARGIDRSRELFDRLGGTVIERVSLVDF
jgi:hypothetical protein